MKLCLVALGTLCLMAICVIPIEGRVRDVFAKSVDIVDSSRTALSASRARQNGQKLADLGFSKTKSTEETEDSDGNTRVRTIHTYSLSTTAENLMAHAEELGKHLPDLFTADTIANLHSLKERSEAGDEEVAAILGHRSELRITFTEEQPSRQRKKRLVGAVIGGITVAAAGSTFGWWRR